MVKRAIQQGLELELHVDFTCMTQAARPNGGYCRQLIRFEQDATGQVVILWLSRGFVRLFARFLELE